MGKFPHAHGVVEKRSPATEARRHLADFEVIVVDDGSADGTPAVAARLAARFPCVSVVRHETNQGVGAAYYTGLSLAKVAVSRRSSE